MNNLKCDCRAGTFTETREIIDVFYWDKNICISEPATPENVRRIIKEHIQNYAYRYLTLDRNGMLESNSMTPLFTNGQVEVFRVYDGETCIYDIYEEEKRRDRYHREIERQREENYYSELFNG